jgi:hypothetical protein
MKNIMTIFGKQLKIELHGMGTGELRRISHVFL